MRARGVVILLGCSVTSCGGTPPEPSSPVAGGDQQRTTEEAEYDQPADEPVPQEKSAASDEDVQTILQLVIEDEELNRHLHLEEPGRFPFKISGSAVPSSVELVKGTQPVVIVAEPSAGEAVLEFTEMDLGATSGTLRFRYDVEGITGTATVNKGEYGWEVKRTRIVER